MMIAQDITLLRNDRAAAGAPPLLHPSVLTFLHDNVNADQRRIDRIHGALNRRAGRVIPTGRSGRRFGRFGQQDWHGET